MNKTIGQKIRRLRQNKDLSQDNMADELGITKGAYSKLERGVTAISVDRLAEIANIFNVEIALFFRDATSISIMDEHGPGHDFATKSDIEELARMLLVFREELNVIRDLVNPEHSQKTKAAKKK